MKSFKEYLTESKRTYQFRIKVANCNLDNEMLDKLEHALNQFDLVDISKPKSLPVTHAPEFAKMGPVERQIIDVEINYPATQTGLRQVVHSHTSIPLECIVVTTKLEDEMEPNPVSQHEEGPVLQNGELPTAEGAQDQVGFKRVDSLLKQLTKDKHEPESVEQGKSAPKEKKAASTSDLPQGNISPMGSKQNKIPSPIKGR
jgi:hypothetical protein